ncbi:MAG: ROK family protein [Anaerolineaceae bacterium]|nr:ROK family protein [Anaerolineaceae bacterium]MBN2678332.1 ROK family protein [Anaerolineaceae bacterium]
MEVLGIDIGGSGIKAAPVNLQSGEMAAERFRLETPDPSKPKRVAEVIAKMTDHYQWKGKIGCGFPGIVRHGIVHTAANLHKGWLELNADALFEKATGCDVRVINDADAAGLAEMNFGAGRDHHKGVVLMITFGTGIGTAVFLNGVLLPNTEFGHVELDGKDAEKRATAAVRDRKNLTWEEWGGRVNHLLCYLESLFSPDLVILGGGVSKDYKEFFPFIHLNAKLVPAEMRNQAGIIGAALAWSDEIEQQLVLE